jgi:hypothetical protein
MPVLSGITGEDEVKLTKIVFINDCNVPASITKDVIKSLGGWESFKDYAPDVANHGADAGFPGFIYYSDTLAFTNRHMTAILAYAKEQANELDCSGAYSMIASFGVFRGDDVTADDVIEALHDDEHDLHTGVLNVLAWYMLEEVCRSYVNIVER